MKKINWTKVKHVATVSMGLLAAFAGIAYQSSIEGNEVAPGITFGVLAGLILVLWSRWQVIVGKPDDAEVSDVARVLHFASGAAGMLVPIVVMISSKFAAGSKAFIVGGYVSTFLGDLAKAEGAAAITNSAKKVGLLVVVSASLFASPSLADEPKQVWKYGPSVSAAVGYVDLKTGDYYVGPSAIALGPCLGLTYVPFTVGVDGCFNIQVGSAEPNRYFPSLMIHWRDYFNGGIGLLGQQRANHDGVFWHFLALLGGRFAFAGG